MKKLVLALTLAVSLTGAFAQKSNVSKAKNKALMESPDFAGAREAIKPALTDSTTKNDAYTWYVAGLIGYKENDGLYTKAVMNQPFDADVKGKAILESYKYFLESAKLDQLPDAKGKVKPKYIKEIKPKLKEFYSQQQNLIGYGAYLFDKKRFDESLNVFEVFMAIPKQSFMNNEISTSDSTYNMIKYYAAASAANAKKHDKAIAIYEDLKDDKYETLAVYQLLYEEYKTVKDTANYVKTLKEGFEKFPTDPYFLQNLINHYIYSNKMKDALAYLNTAIEKEPKVAQYQLVKGNLDESQGNYESARAAFDKALAIDPTMADAHAGIGRIFYNRAVNVLKAAEELKDMKKVQIEKKKADDLFKESIPFFKKATEVNPKDIDYKQTLKQIYYRLNMIPEFEAISAEIKAAQQQ